MNERKIVKIKNALFEKARRIIPFLVIPVLVMSFFPFRVNAAENTYNYRDLNPQIGTNGNLTTFTIVPPAIANRFEIRETYGPNAGKNLEIGTGIDSAYHRMDPDDWYNIYFRPFRRGNRYLELSNIPNGSIFTFMGEYEIIDQDTGQYIDGFIRGLQFYCHYFDENGTLLGSNSTVVNFNSTVPMVDAYSYPVHDTFEYVCKMDKPVGAKYVGFTLLLGYAHSNVMVGANINYKNLKIEIAINSSALSDMNNQTIIDQNDTIINGTPGQNQQISDSNDKMESAGDKLGDLNDQMQVEKPDAEDMDVSIDSLVPGTSILAYTQPILEFWENPTLKAMLIIVMTLVLVSWVMFGKKG